MADESVAGRLQSLFLEELADRLRAMSAELLALEARPDDAERLRALFRIVHTLKGAAHSAGVPLVASCCHRLETLLASARAGAIVLGPREFDGVLAAIDALDDAHRRLAAGESLAGSPLESHVRSLRALEASLRVPAAATTETPLDSLPAAPADAPPEAMLPRPRPSRAAPPPPSPVPTAPPAVPHEEHVRVRVEQLESMLALSSRLVMAEQRLEARAAEAAALAESLSSPAPASPDGDRPGTAGRASAESLRRLVRLTRILVADTHALGAMTSQVSEHAGRLLMRPFRDAAQPLARVVRDAAAATGKRARLVVTGAEIEADRRVLDTLREVLPHLARNAVDHGIELPADRARGGKPATGTIGVDATVRGRQLVVTVADDGMGVDVAALRAQAARRGDPVPAPDDHDALLATIFESGVSTRLVATATSGRGVGLDAVRSAVTGVGGSVHVESTAGEGTRFVITCPLNLALTRALLFASAGRRLAVPTTALDRVIRLDHARVRRSQGQRVVSLPAAPAPVRLVSLGSLFGLPTGSDGDTATHAAVLSVGGMRLAIAVDELLSEAEIVVRPIPQLGSALPYLGGAALVGGEVVLVLNPPALAQAVLALRSPEPASPASAEVRRSHVLVVDDSVTTRTLEQSVLEGAGYDVTTAVDGADAWRSLQERGADLVVADVEMPRMDGFALCEAIRREPRFRSLPVVLVTALESAEHRLRGLEAGADAYIGKSSFDQALLLDVVRQLLEHR